MKTLRATMTIDILDKMPLILHETVGSGTFKGEKFDLIRSTNQNTHILTYKGKSYEYTTENIMIAIIDAIEKGKK